MLLVTLGVSFLENLLTGKGAIKAGDSTFRTGKFLTSPHPLTNFQIQKYYQNEPIFNGVYSRNNLPKINDVTYVINLDEFKPIGTRWIALHVNDNNTTYFYRFGVEHIPKEIKNFMQNKSITKNIYRIQACHSIISRYLCIGFIDFMLRSKNLLYFTSLSSSNKYEKSDKLILKYFQ